MIPARTPAIVVLTAALALLAGPGAAQPAPNPPTGPQLANPAAPAGEHSGH